jgi:hypothetical protein
MLDEVVYIDENKNSNQDVIFIPLDENWVKKQQILILSYFFKFKNNLGKHKIFKINIKSSKKETFFKK